MKNIIDIVNNRKCTGCGACVSTCSRGAISVRSNEEGFLVPVVNKSKCIGCGQCNRACPMLNELSREKQYFIPKVYAGWNKNEKVRLKSSSGGVFSILAEYFLRKKGYVCGAAFDDKNYLRHIIISNRKDLQKLRGSKYVQSEIGGVLREIKELLEKKKWVLFSGTPCQVAGLKNFLRKDYETLLTVDIVCHGVPSPLVFEKYLKEVEKKYKAKIDKIEFRNKSTGWRFYSFVLSNNKRILYKNNPYNDLFFKGFLNNLYLNSICTSCPFAKFPRFSDITLGDYWGIWDYKQKLDDDKGTSIITLNNKKGDKIFDLIRNELFFEKIPSKIAIEKLKVISLPCVRHINRGVFFEDLKKQEKVASDLIGKHLNSEDQIGRVENKVGIFNMRLPTNNFGAILQSFALYKTIDDLGYEVRVINYVSDLLDSGVDKLSVLNLDKFREDNIKMTSRYTSDVDLLNLNKQFGIFIVGSDQVWNFNYLNGAFKDNIGKYFLNFVHPSKNIFSYAASFAENHWDGSVDEINTVKKALKYFSSVSVREKSGVNICKDLFDVKAECVLDPTLLLDEENYQKLIDSEHIEQSAEKYFAYFTLDKNLEENISKDEVLRKFVDKNRFQLKNIRGEVKRILGQDKFIYNSIPGWLNYIKNSEFIITDSYHCVIFAILFKKQFLVIERGYAGNDRLNSLLSILKIKNKFYPSLEGVSYNDVSKDEIDYVKVYKELNLERKKSIDFLKKSLDVKTSDLNRIRKLEEELTLVKIDELNFKSQNQTLQTRSEELELQNQTLQTGYEELESQNQTLQTRSEELELQNQTLRIILKKIRLKNKALQVESKKLNLAIKSYLDTKTFRYVRKIKKLLLKVGIKKFKL